MTIVVRLAAIDFPSEMKNISTAQNIVLNLAEPRSRKNAGEKRRHNVA